MQGNKRGEGVGKGRMQEVVQYVGGV